MKGDIFPLFSRHVVTTFIPPTPLPILFDVIEQIKTPEPIQRSVDIGDIRLALICRANRMLIDSNAGVNFLMDESFGDETNERT